MNRKDCMDYEKEYNHAFEIAKGYWGGVPDGIRMILESMFPQLRKGENEGEKIKQELMVFISQFAPEHLKVKYMNWLEKQKENPKNADSIPADCASNARCPYKIHGDEDFIGDIKDTPAYHFGFDEGVRSEREKQKEQKPEIKYVYPKFRKGDVIEPIIPNGHFIPVRVVGIWDGSYSCRSDDNKAYLSLPIKNEDEYRLVEQNQPAEWSEEDERMWKSALWHIKNSCGNGGKNSGEFEVYQWFENRLKSLRPQPHLQFQP